MSEKVKEAFPRPVYDFMPGMTLRDYFAAKAMQGLIHDGLALILR